MSKRKQKIEERQQTPRKPSPPPAMISFLKKELLKYEEKNKEKFVCIQ